MGKIEKTVDLGFEKEYEIKLDREIPLRIAKLHSIGRRGNQQDAFGVTEGKKEIFSDKGIMAVVADGMGGLSDGEKVSMTAVISCLNYFDTHTLEANDYSVLVDMTENANREVREVLGNVHGHSGSTLVAVWIRENRMYIVSVGDSRIYMCRDGRLGQLTEDHNYANRLKEMVENGEITEEEARNDPQKNALTCYIGMNTLDLIGYTKEPIILQAGDRIMLMTDGVYGSMTDQEMIQAMEYSLPQAAMNMGMQIEGKRKKNQDNYTALIIEYEG